MKIIYTLPKYYEIMKKDLAKILAKKMDDVRILILSCISIIFLFSHITYSIKGGNYLKPFVYFFLHYKQISFVYIFAVYDNTRTVCALYVLFFILSFQSK